jgi:hypothetical protein
MHSVLKVTVGLNCTDWTVRGMRWLLLLVGCLDLLQLGGAGLPYLSGLFSDLFSLQICRATLRCSWVWNRLSRKRCIFLKSNYIPYLCTKCLLMCAAEVLERGMGHVSVLGAPLITRCKRGVRCGGVKEHAKQDCVQPRK